MTPGYFSDMIRTDVHPGTSDRPARSFCVALTRGSPRQASIREISCCRNGDGTGPALHSSLLETIAKIVQIGGAARARGGSHVRLARSPHATGCARTRPWYLQTKPPRTAPSAWDSRRERGSIASPAFPGARAHRFRLRPGPGFPRAAISATRAALLSLRNSRAPGPGTSAAPARSRGARFRPDLPPAPRRSCPTANAMQPPLRLLAGRTVPPPAAEQALREHWPALHGLSPPLRSPSACASMFIVPSEAERRSPDSLAED